MIKNVYLEFVIYVIQLFSSSSLNVQCYIMFWLTSFFISDTLLIVYLMIFCRCSSAFVAYCMLCIDMVVSMSTADLMAAKLKSHYNTLLLNLLRTLLRVTTARPITSWLSHQSLHQSQLRLYAAHYIYSWPT